METETQQVKEKLNKLIRSCEEASIFTEDPNFFIRQYGKRSEKMGDRLRELRKYLEENNYF